MVEDTDEAVADCALRLVRLLDRADAIPVLQPAISRELHYWLLAGRHGRAVRGLTCPGGAARRIARAVAVLRGEFNRTIRVDRLAAEAGMSPSSFHHHFRAVTSLSPMQFQKQLRLIEARRRIVGDGITASRAALEVGYESVTQFTREYAACSGYRPCATRARAGPRADIHAPAAARRAALDRMMNYGAMGVSNFAASKRESSPSPVPTPTRTANRLPIRS